MVPNLSNLFRLINWRIRYKEVIVVPFKLLFLKKKKKHFIYILFKVDYFVLLYIKKPNY